MLQPRTYEVIESSQTLLFLSVEGEKREKLYFEAIENNIETISERRFTLIVGAADSEGSLSAPNHVLARAKQYQMLRPYTDPNRIWLVMDMDRGHIPKLHEMLPDITQRGFRLAVSNPCFEIWLWLHEHEADIALTDCKSLKRQLNFKMDQWQREPNLEWVQTAIARAEALPGSNTVPFPDNPGTQVGELFRYLGLSPLNSP